MLRLVYSRHWPKIAGLLAILAMAFLVSAVYLVSTWFSEISDPFVRYALTFVSVQIGLLLSLALGLILGKQINVRRSHAKNLRLNSLKDLVAQYAAGEDLTQILVQRGKTHPNEFLEVLENSLRILKGSARRRVELLLEQSDAYQSLLRQTVDRDPNHALKAISLLRKVNNPDCQTAIERALSHKAPMVQMMARTAVLSGHSELAQWRVLEDLPHLPFWHRVVLFHQISSDSSVLLQFLSQAFLSERDEMVLAALEFVISRQRLLSLGNTDHLATSPTLEIRIKYFKALPFFPATPETPPLLQSGLDDSDWRVRAMAARACGLLRISSLAPRLLEIVSNSEISAETGHAARALTAIGGEARKSLQALSSSGSEMVHRIITEVMEREILLGIAISP